MYSDFNFYTDVYGGKDIKSEANFKRLAGKACAFIDYQTFGRMKGAELTTDVLHSVRLCECALSDSIASLERSDGILSENNDGYSVTYGKGTDSVNSKHNRGIVTFYLWDTGYLYRGAGG